MEKTIKNLLDKIIFMQNYLLSLPVKNKNIIAEKSNDINDELKKDIREQLEVKFEKLYDNFIGFAENVIQGNLELKQ
jgi:hypothetical protein